MLLAFADPVHGIIQYCLDPSSCSSVSPWLVRAVRSKSVKLFHCWLHTSFIDNGYVCLSKAQLDKVCLALRLSLVAASAASVSLPAHVVH
jgi:hypothetical protein